MVYQPLVLAKQIGVSRSDAKKYIEEYFLMYPGIKEYMEEIQKIPAKKWLCKNSLGRKINIKDYNSKNPMIRNYAERQAINAPIQGTAADIIKRAMIKIYKKKAPGCYFLKLKCYYKYMMS